MARQSAADSVPDVLRTTRQPPRRAPHGPVCSLRHPADKGPRKLHSLALAGALIAALAAAAAACGDKEPVLDAQAARGKKIAYDKNCTSCHTADGSRAEGPTWKNLYGSTVLLNDGSSVVADDAYLTRSVTNPRSQQVAGYRTAMPTTPISEDEIAAINAYIRALKQS